MGKPSATPQMRAIEMRLIFPDLPAIALACAMAALLKGLPSEARRMLVTGALVDTL